MRIKIISQKDRHTSTWAGGFTNELWIFPQNGSYASRNFQARISSATVQLQESDFTILPGVIRYITPLNGGFTLSHPDGQTITMAPLDTPYRFDGGIATHCIGTATDFNLMLKGVDGDMTIVRGRQTVYGGIYCVYPISGNVTVNDKVFSVNHGELLVIRTENGEQAVIETLEAILCKIFI